MRLALVLLLFIVGCGSLATYNLFVRPLPEGTQSKQDPTLDDWIQLAVFGELGGPGSGAGSTGPLYQWTDPSGTVRFTENPGEIPQGVPRQVVR